MSCGDLRRLRTMSTPPALVIIDVQQGMDDPKWGARNNPDAEHEIGSLLAAWRDLKWPVIHVQHMSEEADSPLRPDSPGNELKPVVRPREGEPLFQKTVNSAFIGTTLEAHLRREGIGSLVMVGITTDHCVSTTARMASNLGFEVIVVGDATATFERTGPDGAWYSAEQMHRAALASLHGEFAQVQSAEDVLRRLHPEGA